MEILLPFMIGILFAVGLYFMLHRHLFKLILGLILFGLATNLFLFVVGGITRSSIAIIPETEEVATEPYADPVPQALLLTAIVIGFGIQAFAIVLVRRVYQTLKSNNLDELNSTDKT
ncbi:multisubunit sodium/proton antiporter MrpC subunit [Pontibacter ummariensis]|uniref:Multisubunit sodium/proton antiporter, MrpC subunit n=1 Tax=Pontibacter ummariensis TaxID=1610492 RepID=A0A239BWZ5_9BACT|nr:NADH-quinone oxidoreductase subunit K [Pontibacter ummariensis]PRY15593.1 multisubunit sodium/proton antiporter MrpC subunit [Pontibacter ummariensis]SNS11958.1 multisubunit sodium/proton antiporter, MrpC subunit [Pontibacter ummariensis]